MAASALQALAANFSTAAFRKLANDMPSPDRLELLEQSGSFDESTLGAAFDAAYRELVRRYRCEYVFKNEIVSKVVFGRHRPTTATALLEQPMGTSEADLLVLNGTSTIYEVKSNYDSLARLPKQLDDYMRRAEHVNVVTSQRHLAALERMVPTQVGIIMWKPNGALSTVRRSTSGLASLSGLDLFELLRTDEALKLASRYLNYESDVPRGHLRRRLREIITGLEVDVVHAMIVNQLRQRGAVARSLVTQPTFPRSLRAAAYGTPLSKVAAGRVATRLSEQIGIMSH